MFERLDGIAVFVLRFLSEMIYLSGAVRPELLGLRKDLGVIMTPMMGNRPDLSNTLWGADNGCFARPEKFTLAGYYRFLNMMNSYRSQCLFATAPDLVGDAAATLELSYPVLPTLRNMGYRAALIGQDGMENYDLDWSSFDVFFIGGTTKWKLSHGARDMVKTAKTHRKWVHMGRVNSEARLRTASMWGCDSADGTYLCFGPDKNIPKLLSWLNSIQAQPMLKFA